jgi:hypothetical protein
MTGPGRNARFLEKFVSMAASGLERKCDIRAYVAKVENIIR